MMKHTEDFKQEAVRIALTSGLSRRRVAAGSRRDDAADDRQAPRPHAGSNHTTLREPARRSPACRARTGRRYVTGEAEARSES